MQIAVVGAGYVGLVTGIGFAELGHTVFLYDNNQEKLDEIQLGSVPFYEPGLSELLNKHLLTEKFKVARSLGDVLETTSTIVIGVGTPSSEDGSTNLSNVESVTEEILSLMQNNTNIIMKSTVPPGTGSRLERFASEKLRGVGRHQHHVEFISNPEFLREGSAVLDVLSPSRIVVGSQSRDGFELMKDIYKPLLLEDVPFVTMDRTAAELTKYVANAMLASRISFMNEIADFAELVGADIDNIKTGIGLDPRIGSDFLNAGLGYGGSCFPKDIASLRYEIQKVGLATDMLDAISSVNNRVPSDFVSKIVRHFGGYVGDKCIGIWGLAFKPHSDDMREAVSQKLIRSLRAHGVMLKLYDPEAMGVAKALFDDPDIYFCADMYEVAKNCDGLVLVTEWPEFKYPDFKFLKSIMRSRVIFDGRNLLDQDAVVGEGFTYYGRGR